MSGTHEAAVAERIRPVMMSMIITLFVLATLVTLTFLPALLVTVLRLQRRVAASLQMGWPGDTGKTPCRYF